MSPGRRRPGARGAAALLLLGVLSLGAGVLLDLHDRDDRRVVARDVGAVPGSPAGPAGSTPVAAVLPVLSGVDDPPGAPGPTGVSGLSGGFDGARPSAPPPRARPPGSPIPDPARPVPGGARTVEPEPRFADPGPAPVPPRVVPRPLRPLPAPLFPQEPGLVSAVYELPRPAPAVAPVPVVPATLELPAHAVTAPVAAVGTDPSGGMVVPEQVRTVGWWAPGVLPGGAAGSAVIAGHVDSRLQGVGVLAVLPTLLEGEPLVVRDAGGRAATFRVAARREYGKYDLPRDVFRRTGPPQLVLITCGGRFDPAARSYESNIVVYAVPA